MCQGRPCGHVQTALTKVDNCIRGLLSSSQNQCRVVEINPLLRWRKPLMPTTRIQLSYLGWVLVLEAVTVVLNLAPQV